MVFTSDGAVSGARVAAHEIVSSATSNLGVLTNDEPLAYESTTDSEGRFQIAVDGSKPFRLRAWDELHAPAFVARTYAGDVHRIELFPGGSLELTVVDEAGVPQAGIECGVRGSESDWQRTGVTSAAGALVLERLAPGPATAWARAPSQDYVTAQRVLTIVDGRLTQSLQLLWAAVMEGEVRDKLSDETIAGARLSISNRVTTSDARGRFSFGGFRPGAQGTHVVEATADGYRPAAAEFRSPANPGAVSTVIRLERGCRARIRFVDPLGAPIARATLRVYVLVRSSQFAGSIIERMSLSDAEGVVQLEGLDPGSTHRLIGLAEGFGAAVRIVVADALTSEANREVDLGDMVLSTPGEIAGVMDRSLGFDGVVVLERAEAGGEVTLASRDAGRSGEFRFAGLSAGTWRLAYYGRSEDRGALAESALGYQTVELAPSEVRGDIVLAAGKELRGNALDPEGEGVGRLIVIVTAANGNTAESSSNDGGLFTLPVPGPSPFALEIIDLSLRFETWRSSGLELDEPITANLTPLMTEHEIRGHLITPAGEPLPKGIFVHFTHKPTGRRLMRVGVPSPTGWFTMKNLDPVAYDLSLVDFDQHFEALKVDGVTPGGDAVEIVLEARRQ